MKTFLDLVLSFVNGYCTLKQTSNLVFLVYRRTLPNIAILFFGLQNKNTLLANGLVKHVTNITSRNSYNNLYFK